MGYVPEPPFWGATVPPLQNPGFASDYTAPISQLLNQANSI